jgi:DNA-binding LytR/AlgR family response regulator
VLLALREGEHRDALAAQLSGFTDVVVIGLAENARRAFVDAKRMSPDLVFLDRGLLTARDVRDVRGILARGSPLIAFTMTHAQSVDAFEPDAIDYLRLPATKQRARKTIDRAKERLDGVRPVRASAQAKDDALSSVSETQASATFIERIPARTRDGFRIIPVEELVSAVSHREYVHLTTSGGERHIILYALKDLLSKLDPARFIRLSRGTLVNVAFVRRVVPARSGLLTVALSNGDEHTASRLRARELRQWLLRL